jgi:hypothetical protein
MIQKTAVATSMFGAGRPIRCSDCPLRCFELRDGIAAHISALGGHRHEPESVCLRDSLGAALDGSLFARTGGIGSVPSGVGRM